MNFTGLLRITLFLENNDNDSSLLIGCVTKNRKIRKRTIKLTLIVLFCVILEQPMSLLVIPRDRIQN